ncbi:MAG: isocitrate/isopropylmalate family dehydrogenase [Clostridiales bacterium]|nr:isocitrate/isopropylmalate family dehydrogenase [Clostridiales bacterium]
MRKEAVLAGERFAALVEEQISRVEALAASGDFIDFKEARPLIIGLCGGDGIGPIISAECMRVLRYLLADKLEKGDIVLKDIQGLTIDNRSKAGKTIPDEVLEEMLGCHVILKGPTMTPQQGDGYPNLESANVAMRRHLDLFANVRPVRVPELGIDWTFFRENTEGAYAVGDKGFEAAPGLAVDFTFVSDEGCRRIIQAAFDFAVKKGKTKVTAVTKANIIKTTDGRFIELFGQIGALYPQIEKEERYIDIMSAKLIDERVQAGFQVVVLPNLYGDILTDEAAQLQGGVGTAGSANIGKRYAMFEAIHGSADRMVAEGRGEYANPASLLRAAAMLLSHVELTEQSALLDRALDLCLLEEAKLSVTGGKDGATCHDFGSYILETLERISAHQ